MTTKEMIEKLNNMDLEVKRVNSELISVIKRDNQKSREVAHVSTNKMYQLSIIFNDFETYVEDNIQKEVFDVLYEYSTTPVHERGNNRYFQYQLKIFAMKEKDYFYRRSWLTYDCDACDFLLSTRENDMMTVFEEGDPILGGVINLDLFDAIEVDENGNEK